jgi:hypothetical protein
MVSFLLSGCFLIRNSQKSEAIGNLIAVYNSQKIFERTNNRYADSVKELSLDLKTNDKSYRYGFNPNCISDELVEQAKKIPNYGFPEKNFFQSWLDKQTCRENGYTFYAVKKLSPVDFEVHQINEKRELSEIKIP